ncbi:DEAD/DEAH box helicase [Cesiribacter sp. SM1]|uniref:DEAD/DEAH box helicase n=1 Tax=Cesiribacter sp. SM1 TaxID=2861196 RepID=UPI001CD3EC33|nr:DEAD/DEAH box helicase [Cesiribacter sp. SM1]
MQFSSLGLSEPLLRSLASQKFEQPFPIQQEAIPAILAGKDIFGVAQTGSGKTAAFVLPILELLQKAGPAKSRYIKVLVLVPTRELAAQVADVFKEFSNGLSRRINTLAVYGGVSINPQMMALASAEIVVATPGRLLDLVSSNAVHLSAVEMLVLDEADKILNLGFQEEIDKIFALLPPRRQNVLFSATIGDDVRNIKETLLRDPLLIEVGEENQQHELISQVAYLVAPERKGPLLRYLIKQHNMQQVLVFTSSIRTADNLVGKLSKNGIQASSLHSQKSQGARTEVLQKFKTGKLRVLIATDLASRGIDIEKLPYVINFELPRSPKDYVHRIGRTGRASAKGEAITIITAEDQHHFGVIQKKMGKKVSIVETDDLDLKGY